MNIRHHLISTITIAIAANISLGQSVTAESVPEIGWSSRISSMGLDQIDNIGEQYTFYCQPAEADLIHSPVWGTAEYTVNSGICSTAVHSGIIVPESGGEITLKLIEGKSFYTGSHKNEITSKDHRHTEIAFVFVGKKVNQKTVKTEEAEPKRQPSVLERMLMDGLQRGVERTIDKTIDDLLN